MFDRRVIRGNTYAVQTESSNAQSEAQRLHLAQQERRRQEAARASKKRGGKPGTPDAVPGRKHIEVQTGLYLEELSDKVPEQNSETQTEPFLDRPPSPLFMPAKIGVDQYTQVLPGELFSFDIEVEPILEVLLGKTLEQSMMEVLEEEELENIRSHQREFHQKRHAELAEVQRLEAEALRRVAEKERRMKQEEDRALREAMIEEKVAARSFAKEYLSSLHGNVFDKLLTTGHFYDPVAREVEELFLPWLQSEVSGHLADHFVAHTLADALLENALIKSETLRKGAEEAEAARVEAARLAAEELAKAAAAPVEGEVPAEE